MAVDIKVHEFNNFEVRANLFFDFLYCGLPVTVYYSVQSLEVFL